MIIAGEASGDTLGAELVKALRRSPALEEMDFPTEFFGTGGAKMTETGVELAFDMTTHAVVGVWEVVKNYGKFKRLFDQLLNLAFERIPDIVVLIDYPGFNLRFARALRKRARTGVFRNWQPRIVYYVSPQIWAWHGSRIHQIADDIDLLLTIFPFEKDWYLARKPNFHVEFVGHPLIDRYESLQLGKSFESKDIPLVVLLPGSRARELKKHLPVLLEAARLIESSQKARFRIVLSNGNLEYLAKKYNIPTNVEVAIGSLSASLKEASVALASSGTVTMEAAYFGVPTVVLYKTSWSTYLLGKLLISVKYIAMPNLLAGEMIYPEYIQGAATPSALAGAALDLLNNMLRRNVVKTKLAMVVKSLGPPGASDRAAEAILNLK
jgi:lipid-A-disaccharide synthase